MINIDRKISGIGKEIYELSFDEGKIIINLNGRNDLYWHFMPTSNTENIITKENYFLTKRITS